MAQRAPQRLFVHVGFAEETIHGQQFDKARRRGQQPRTPLLPPQLTIAPRGFDHQRQVVPFGGKRADQFAREMKDAALVIRLTKRFADNQYLLPCPLLLHVPCARRFFACCSRPNDAPAIEGDDAGAGAAQQRAGRARR